MREILFKAKRIDNGEWVEGLLQKMWREWHIINPDKENTAYPIDSETICQYTGLTDKNGKRIWENDIVSAWSEGKHAIGKVQRRIDGLYIIYPAYQKKEFWGLSPDGNGKTEVEIIGNIFDNPELMKGE